MSTHTVWGKLDASDLPKIFPLQHLEGYSRFTLVPLFEALHEDFIQVIMKMRGVHHLAANYFSFRLNKQTHQFQLHINSNEDLDEKDDDESIWATGSFNFQWDVPWRSSAAGAYKEEEAIMAEFVRRVMVKLAKANFNYVEYKQKAIERLSQEKWYHLSAGVQNFYRRAS